MLVVAPVLSGYELSSESTPLVSESAELKQCDDQYILQPFTIPVWVKKDSTYEKENRTVQIEIRPQICRVYRKNGQLIEEKDYFLKVLVSIVITDAEENPSTDFRSYLNFKRCTEPGRLFWDHAGEERADKTRKPFNEDNPLDVSDDHLKATVRLAHVTPSLYVCNPDIDMYCESDFECLFYMDTLTLLVTVDYTSTQKELQSSFKEAESLKGSADGLFEYAKELEDPADLLKGFEELTDLTVIFDKLDELKEAKEDYEKAKAIYNQKGDTERTLDIQEQIEFCESYISAFESVCLGAESFWEAKETENYKEAIKKYEEACSYLEKAQKEFDNADDSTLSDICQFGIDMCDDEIENLEHVSAMRTRLLYLVVAAAVIVAAGGTLNWMRKGKRKKPEKDMVVLTVQNAETGKKATIRVHQFDKIGKVRQMAGTKLGVVPYELVYNDEACPPDKTVEECGLPHEAVVQIVPSRKVKAESKKPEEEPEPDETLVQKPEEEPEEGPEEELEETLTLEEGPRLIFGDQVFYITRDSMTIGRGKAADIRIPDPKRLISRIHAKIFKDKGQCWIEDNNSVNGTFIQKDGKYEKIQKCTLSDGDMIALSYSPSEGAHITLQFRTEETEVK